MAKLPNGIVLLETALMDLRSRLTDVWNPKSYCVFSREWHTTGPPMRASNVVGRTREVFPYWAFSGSVRAASFSFWSSSFHRAFFSMFWPINDSCLPAACHRKRHKAHWVFLKSTFASPFYLDFIFISMGQCISSRCCKCSEMITTVKLPPSFRKVQ